MFLTHETVVLMYQLVAIMLIWTDLGVSVFKVVLYKLTKQQQQRKLCLLEIDYNLRIPSQPIQV